MRFECPDCQQRFTAMINDSIMHVLPACPGCHQSVTAADACPRRSWKALLYVLYLPVRLLRVLYAPGSKPIKAEEHVAKATDYNKAIPTSTTQPAQVEDRLGSYVCVHDGEGKAHTRAIPSGADGEQVGHNLLETLKAQSHVCIDCGRPVEAFCAYVYEGCQPLCDACHHNRHGKTNRLVGLRMQDVETEEEAQPFIGRSVTLVSKFDTHINEYMGVIHWYDAQYATHVPWAITVRSGMRVHSDGARTPMRYHTSCSNGQAVDAGADYYVCLREQPAQAVTPNMSDKTEPITPIPGNHYVGEIVRHKRYGFTGMVVTEDAYLKAGGKKEVGPDFLYVAVTVRAARREFPSSSMPVRNGRAYPRVGDYRSWQHV